MSSEFKHAYLCEIFPRFNIDADPVGGVSWEWYGMRMRTPAAGLPVALESTHNNLHHTTFTLCTSCCCAVNHRPDILLLFLKTHCVQPHLETRWHQWKQSCVISLSCLQPFWSTFGFRSNVFTLTVDAPPHFKQSYFFTHRSLCI